MLSHLPSQEVVEQASYRVPILNITHRSLKCNSVTIKLLNIAPQTCSSSVFSFPLERFQLIILDLLLSQLRFNPSVKTFLLNFLKISNMTTLKHLYHSVLSHQHLFLRPCFTLLQASLYPTLPAFIFLPFIRIPSPWNSWC